MAYKVLACILFLAFAAAGKEKSRWSRQLSSYTSDISDWVPLPGPPEREPIQIRRQAIAEPRILSEPFPGFGKPTGFSQDDFPPRPLFNAQTNRQLYLQAVPSAPQNYLTDQGFGQGLKFGLAQPNSPFSQGFVSPQFNFDTIPQIKSRPPTISSAGKYDGFLKPQPLPPQIRPQFVNPAPKIKPDAPKFVDGYRIVNTTNFGMPKKAPNLQKVKFDNFDKSKESQGKSKAEREEVQLLYVPIESLNRGQFNFRSPLTSAQIVNTDLYNQNLRINPLKQNLAAEYQRPLSKPLETFNSQEALNDFNRQLIGFEQSSKFSSLSSPFPTAPSTTPKPKKLKPHQPPLAIFLAPESKESNVKVGDVLNSLKNADSVPVLDSVNPLNAPKVFIGPSNLSPPDNYVKFELPYLSNIDNVDKKLRQLPFFVAPLSYNTPQGFAKIPFPSPHVGSVVINSQIKESSSTPAPQPVPETYENPYMRPQVYNRPQYQQNTVTQKPQVSYYSTVAPKPSSPPNYHNNYYSIEQQTVSTLSPPKQASTVKSPAKPGSYFLSNFGDQYTPSQYVNFPEQVNYNQPQRVKPYSVVQPIETTTTPRTTVTTTAKSSSTHPSPQLLETHNPYSINHAFHFNTPVDYQNFFDEYKETHATPGTSSSTTPATTVALTEAPTAPSTTVTQIPKQRYSQSYVQNYSPEIHYESEIQSSRRPTYQTKDYTKIRNEPTPRTEYKQPVTEDLPSQNELEINKINSFTAYKESTETQPPKDDTNSETISYVPEPTAYEKQPAEIPQQYNQQDVNYSYEEVQPTEASTTTTTTSTTRRTALRTRGRPRYTTAKTDTNEYTTRATLTRRPYRERKQPTNRPKYEPNRITTEKTDKEYSESIESTTKSQRSRTRGRIQYKPTGNDEISETKRAKQKEQDLAYQRDVLHQNYPVTLMERTSTVDIDAITESTAKLHITNTVDESKSFDTENAYTNDKPSITENINAELAGDIYASKAVSSESETQYRQQGSSGHNDEYVYQTKSSIGPSANEEIKEQPSGEEKQENGDDIYQTSPVSPVTEQNIPNYSANNEYPTEKQVISEDEETKIHNQDVTENQNQEEQVVETTPSYNRVRVRPGLVRQYQSSSTESTRKTERKKLSQPITYRPAFDRRRTTMRIEEIEADLKTKPVNSRTQYDDYRHPVYKPEPTTEPPATVPSAETTNKRGQFRRRRPVYTTTTEATARKTYDVKNRFRGRRPTEKPTEKPEVQTDVASSTTPRSPLYNRFNHRTKLSERYNKRPDQTQEEAVTEDQEPNYSINRPKYAALDTERWSPKISKDTFKPYNPNDLIEENKPSETKVKDEELDIITARNEYDDILISVTPATNTNNRVNKKIADIPSTLEAYVEQSKVAKTESNEPVSTFESMLEEVMKSLEEQDEDEYTNKVMKHKGGEIGEIPPEKIITSGENYSSKTTTPIQEETTTAVPATDELVHEDDEDANRKNRRRGFWKKVKVRPITESFEVAESQYYPNTVNTLGQSVSKISSDKSIEINKKKMKVTTYKPRFQFIKDFFESDDSAFDLSADIDIPKINATRKYDDVTEKVEANTEPAMKETIADSISPGDMDWGTGSPDPTLEDASFYSEPTQPSIDRSDGFSFMEYLFGVHSSEETRPVKNETREESTKASESAFELETTKGTTDSYIPEEITADTVTENSAITEDQKNISNDATEKSQAVESTSVSSFMDPSNVISTSMSTEVSHETEICFRGKCIKTKKDLLL
ncbi:uncharacterized protein LOC119836723 [Zerene cesonia]|uniref:uncharacterized protein LOC119836723 n=1 Tax=Zerene cesonia TaxID=33412 RepID=UPI0018E543AB|nr:uncharacterized protein LOC119836723 [Zerene cesonia]